MLPSRSSVPSHGYNRRLIAETGAIPIGTQLIQDTFPFEVKDTKNCFAEDVNGKEQPVMKIKGLISLGDHENANGRVYGTKSVLRPAIEQIMDDIGARQVLGEFDHPETAKIHLDRASHLMTKVWMEGHKVYGEAEVLHRLPFGACLRGLFEHKIRVGISSRGVGDMELVESGGKEIYRISEGYTIITWDVVAEPSVTGAIMNISEGLSKKIAPLKKQRGMMPKAVYESKLVQEINKYFDLKPY